MGRVRDTCTKQSESLLSPFSFEGFAGVNIEVDFFSVEVSVSLSYLDWFKAKRSIDLSSGRLLYSKSTIMAASQWIREIREIRENTHTLEKASMDEAAIKMKDPSVIGR